MYARVPLRFAYGSFSLLGAISLSGLLLLFGERSEDAGFLLLLVLLARAFLAARLLWRRLYLDRRYKPHIDYQVIYSTSTILTYTVPGSPGIVLKNLI